MSDINKEIKEFEDMIEYNKRIDELALSYFKNNNISDRNKMWMMLQDKRLINRYYTKANTLFINLKKLGKAGQNSLRTVTACAPRTLVIDGVATTYSNEVDYILANPNDKKKCLHVQTIEKKNKDEFTSIYIDALLKVEEAFRKILEDEEKMKRFNYSFMKFFFFTIENKLYDVRNQSLQNAFDILINQAGNDEELSKGDTQNELDTQDELVMSKLFIGYKMLMESLKVKSNEYDRKFFSDNAVHLLQTTEKSAAFLSDNDRLAREVIDWDFMQFFMNFESEIDSKNIPFSRIVSTQLKSKREMRVLSPYKDKKWDINESDDEECELPLPIIVYRYYTGKAESTIRDQQKKYLTRFEQILEG